MPKCHDGYAAVFIIADYLVHVLISFVYQPIYAVHLFFGVFLFVCLLFWCIWSVPLTAPTPLLQVLQLLIYVHLPI